MKLRPLTPSVSHGTSDRGLPERSDWVGWTTPGSVPPLTTEYVEFNALKCRVEHEALDHTRDEHDREDHADRDRHARGAKRSMNRATHACEAADEAGDDEDDRGDDHAGDEDRSPLPRGQRLHAHQAADVFLPRSTEHDEQRREHDGRRQQHPPCDPLDLATRLRSAITVRIPAERALPNP